MEIKGIWHKILNPPDFEFSWSEDEVATYFKYKYTFIDIAKESGTLLVEADDRKRELKIWRRK